MMKLTKSSRAFRRATAVALAFALTVSVPVANDASAASKKVPTLSAKKKTLYVKGGGKSFTLKVKKNKTKKIVKTKWTTSKKSVAKISKKKKTSVKVTAVKKGTAKITAKVTYKVGKKTKTKKLVCKVTVKATKPVVTKAPAASTAPSADVTAAPSSDVTAAPSADVTTEPTADVTEEPTVEPTVEPTEEPASASSIKVSPEKVTFNAANKAEAVTLSAVVADQNGETMKDQEVEWTSDNTDVKVAKGIVTLNKDAKDGKANVTAAVSGTAITAGAVVVIDATAPTAGKAEVTDYKTITVPFSKEVVKDEKDFKVTVKQDNKENKDVTAELAEDGKSLVLTAKDAFAAADYDIIINGVVDKAGNAIVKDTKVSVTKAESTAAKFNLKTTVAPAPAAATADETLVYVSAVDQYGQDMTALPSTVAAKAVIKGTNYPLTATVSNAATGKVKVSYDAALVEGKTIVLTLTNTVGGTVVGTSDLEISLVKNEGKGVATAIEGVSVTSTNMTVAGTADAPEITLTETESNNVFNIKAALVDKFGYKIEDANSLIKVVSSDVNVISFAKSESDVTPVATATNKGKSSPENGIETLPVKAGTATLRVYLDNDDTVSKEIKVTVNPVALSTLTIDNTKSVNPENNKATSYEIKTNACASVKAADLSYEVTEGKDLCKEVKIYDGTGADAGKVFVSITPVANGLQNKISVKVSSGKISSAALTVVSTINSTPKEMTIDAFGANKVTVGGTATTNFIVKNINGEDITQSVVGDASVNVTTGKDTATLAQGSDDLKVSYDAVAKKGVLTVKGAAIGNCTVLLTCGTATATVSVTVVAAAKITSVDLNKYVDSILGDVTDADLYKLNISAKDQYGNVYKLKSSDITINSAVSGLDLAYFKADGTPATGEDAVAAIAVKSAAPVIAGTNKIVVKVGTDPDTTGVISKNVTVTVKEARAVKTITATADYTKVVAGETAKVTLKGKDQYGKDIDLIGSTIKTTSGGSDIAGGADTNESITIADKGIKVVTYTVEGTNVSTSITLEAVNPSEVDKVVFDNIVTSNSKSYDTATYSVYVENDKAVAATFKAYVGNTLVKVPTGKLSVEYYKTAGAFTVATDGTVTTDGTKGAGKIEARLVNNLNTTVKDVVKEFNVNDAAPVVNKATIGYATKDALGNYTVAAPSLIVKKTAAEYDAVKITAIDQYGQAIPVSATNVGIIGDNVKAITVKGDADGVIKVTTTGQAAPVTITVAFEGKQYTIPVTFID